MQESGCESITCMDMVWLQKARQVRPMKLLTFYLPTHQLMGNTVYLVDFSKRFKCKASLEDTFFPTRRKV